MKTVEELDAAQVAAFSGTIKGEVILPSSVRYNEARKVYNGMIDKHPGMIVLCADVADVMACVTFGRESGLLIAVRGGGHNGGGLGVCDGGMVIDLSALKFVRVNPANSTVRVGGGNLWNEVDHATHAFGLAVPAGIVSSTGVGGLTLGGGVGHLARKYGLTIDNLLEADMVLADGSFVIVSADEHPDLFWAIRGGGGNFGIVTSFKFQAHPVREVYGGPTLWPIERLDEIMAWYHEFMETAPDGLNGFIATMIIPGPPFPETLHHRQFCGIVWCCTEGQERAQELLRPVLDMNPEFEHLFQMPYPAIQSMFDGFFPHGLQWYWRADFFGDLGPEIRAQHLKYGSAIPTPLSQMHLYPISGAAGRVAAKDTPWAYRHAKYAGVIVGVDPDPKNADKITQWCKDYWEALHPYASGGAYSNFMMDEGQERVRDSYGQNYERLVQIKRKYDPNNLFRVNQNIKP